MYPSHFKDIALGIFAAYVIVDILLSLSPNLKHTNTISAIFNHFSTPPVGIVLVIGLAAGLFVYYFSRKSREHFTPLTIDIISKKDIHTE